MGKFPEQENSCSDRFAKDFFENFRVVDSWGVAACGLCGFPNQNAFCGRRGGSCGRFAWTWAGGGRSHHLSGNRVGHAPCSVRISLGRFSPTRCRLHFTEARSSEPAQRTRSNNHGRRASMAMRSCAIESRWRTVTVPFSASPFSPRVSKSTVTQNGVPTSSWRR